MAARQKPPAPFVEATATGEARGPAQPPVTPEAEDASAATDKQSRDALRHLANAERLQLTPTSDPLSNILQRHEATREREAGVALLTPGPIVQGAGEAVPALGWHEISGRRDAMIDTLERPTTISVRASERRLELLEQAGALQAGLDAAQTAKASNSIEKMLAHQIAAAHTAALKLLAYIPTQPIPNEVAPRRPPASSQVTEIARISTAAARLMGVCIQGALALERLKGGGTQRVLVQHQQVVVGTDGSQMVVNPVGRPAGRRGGAPAGRERENPE